MTDAQDDDAGPDHGSEGDSVAEMVALRMEIKAGFEKMSAQIRDVRTDLKIHVLEHHK